MDRNNTIGYKWVSGTDLQRSRSLPVQSLFSQKLGLGFPRNKRTTTNCGLGKKKVPLQSAPRNREIYEVTVDDKDYLKVIADARLKQEHDAVPTMPCILTHACSKKLRACATLNIAKSGTPEADQKDALQYTYGSHLLQRICGKFPSWPSS